MIRVLVSDITKLSVDAVVNAANSSLLGGGGVDGAIHSAAGNGLLKECMGLGGCETGDAKITAGYRLKAKYVIHTVGPVCHGGAMGEDDKLRSCYERSLELSKKYGVESIAFHLISCGVYGFPNERASRIALSVLSKRDLDITISCFSQGDMEIYRKTAKEMGLDDMISFS